MDNVLFPQRLHSLSCKGAGGEVHLTFSLSLSLSPSPSLPPAQVYIVGTWMTDIVRVWPEWDGKGAGGTHVKIFDHTVVWYMRLHLRRSIS